MGWGFGFRVLRTSPGRPRAPERHSRTARSGERKWCLVARRGSVAGLMSAKRTTETRAPGARRVPTGRLPKPAASVTAASRWPGVIWLLLAPRSGPQRSEPGPWKGSTPRLAGRGHGRQGGWRLSSAARCRSTHDGMEGRGAVTARRLLKVPLIHRGGPSGLVRVLRRAVLVEPERSRSGGKTGPGSYRDPHRPRTPRARARQCPSGIPTASAASEEMERRARPREAGRRPNPHAAPSISDYLESGSKSGTITP